MCAGRWRAGESVEEQQALALAAAEEFANEDVRHCAAIGRHGAKLIRNGMKVLTHCNAGWLAFVDIGTATAPMYAAQAAGRKFHVFCDETRPRSQGATLTAWELAQQGISHQIIADNAAGHLMQRGEIDLVIVGSDRTLGAHRRGGQQDRHLHQGGAGASGTAFRSMWRFRFRRLTGI